MLKVFKPIGVREDDAIGNVSDWSGIQLSLIVVPGESIYIEFPEGEPMENVLAMIHSVERGSIETWRVVFDVEDDGLWETLAGGHRLHGMFVEQII